MMKSPPIANRWRSRSVFHALLALFSSVSVSTAAQHALLFRNGDLLTGQLESITPTNGLRWRHADAPAAMQFQPGALAELHLGAQPPPTTTAANFCFVRLTNGDELSGNLKRLNERELVLETWFAGTLTLPRPRVAALRPAGGAPRAVFAGPDGIDGWTQGKGLPGVITCGEWHFLNGAFGAAQSASIARDVKLPPESSMEFDLAWRGTFALAIALYTDSLQPVRLADTDKEPPFCPFYSLQVNSYSTQVLLVQQGKPTRQIGMAIIPMLQQTNQARIAIKSSREQKTLTLLINGVVAKQWMDPEGFGARGTGIRFVHQGQGPLRLANLRITEWDGRLDEHVAPLVANTKDDVARLVNRDSVVGRVLEWQDGKFRISTAGGPIDVPIERVAQLDLATERSQPMPLRPGDVRVFFAGRGSLTFALESWTDKSVRVNSSSFGKAEFAPRAFSRIVFQPQP